MDIFTTLAGFAGLVTWWIHTFLGHSAVYKPLVKAGMNEFTRTVLMVCWHFITYVLALLVLALCWASSRPGSLENQVILGIGVALTLPFAVMFVVLGKWRMGGYWVMPQIYLLGTVGLLQLAALIFPLEWPRHHVLGLVLALMLVTLSLVHILWAQGKTWPAASREQLTELVVGQPRTKSFPGKGLTWLVALFLAAAAGLVLRFPHLQAPSQGLEGLIWTLGGIFLLRGFGGYLDMLLRPWTKELPFGHWNRVLYSPVSLVMGFLALALVTGAG